MAWIVKIMEVLKPEMTKIKIDYALFQDGKHYNNGEVVLDLTELDGKDDKAIEKQVTDILVARCLVMTKIDTIAKNLKALKGTETVVK